MREILAQISSRTVELETLVEGVRPAFARRLSVRLGELLNGMQLDPARLAQEAAIACRAQRCQSEELARLRSHVEQFDKIACWERVKPERNSISFLQEMQQGKRTRCFQRLQGRIRGPRDYESRAGE